MKKITLTFIIIFSFIVLTVYILSVLYPTHNVANVDVPVVSGEFLTMEEISKHNVKNDCYLLIDNRVYDVSTYISGHPGGSRSITSRCGEEVTGIFASIHSNFAWDLLTDYYVAQFVTGEAFNQMNNSVTTLKLVEKSLKLQYPNAEIINIKPKSDFFVSKLIYQNSLYEVHVDVSGQILSEEIENDEYNWSNWDTDKDDLS